MKMNCEMDTAGLERTLTGWEKDQLPFATAAALTKTGTGVKVATVAEMRKVFDRPTPFTLNSVYLQPATKGRLAATVLLKNVNRSGAPPSVWLEPEIEGGGRQAKRTETLLRSKGFLPQGMYYVPGLGADLDRYGNISRGQIVRLMGALEAMPAQGYLATKAGKLGPKAKAQAGDYFVGKPAGGYLPMGVYQRMGDGRLKSILIFVRTPQYHRLLPFYETARATFGSGFKDNFERALRDALILSPTTGVR